MIKRSKFILLFFIFLLSETSASNITVVNGNLTTKINSLLLNEIEYVSTKELAKALNANFYLNPINQKSEIKFKDFTIKFTAKNQFIVLTARKSNLHQIFQLPLSIRSKGTDLFIPIKYAAKYISLAAGLDIIYKQENKYLTVENKKVDTKNLVEWNKKLIDKKAVHYDIFGGKIENKKNGTLIRLRTKDKIKIPTSSVRDNILYIFFNKITIDQNTISKIDPTGLVRNFSIKYIEGNPQIEIKLSDGYDKHEIFYDEEIGELLISIHNKILKNQNSSSSTDIDKWDFNVIVIDPGHGGKDPGAIGLNGIREKDIALAISLELGKLINNNMPDVKVIYTREGDVFPELYKRGQIANENKGDLFISIHCNSTPKKPTTANGIEVYLLRPGRTKEAIDIAEFENSVISLEDDPERYKQLTEENFILVSMANTSNLRYSETFADMLNTEWIKQLDIASRGIKQAGFYVLVGAAMPSVLIETGFISNKEDAKYLNSKKGQKQIAKSIYDAISKYKNFYKTSISNELKGF